MNRRLLAWSQATCERCDSKGQLNLVVELESECDISLGPGEIGKMKCFDVVSSILTAT